MSPADVIADLVTAALPGADKYQPGSAVDDDDLLVFDRIILPKPPQRYVRVNADNGTRAALAVCSRSDSVTLRWQVDCWAPDGPMASWMAVSILDNLLDTRPVIDGWACGQIVHTYSQSPGPEETVMERPVVRALDQYKLLASRL